MHLYIDTADLELVAAYARYGVLDGVTTNPSLVASTENSYREVVTAIAERTDGAVFAQVIGDDVSGMVGQARA
jgi:transaldolase